MAKKYVKIGSIWLNEKNGTKYASVRLGENKSKNPKYNFSVEITVKDANGKVVAKQTDGFVSMFEPKASETFSPPANLKYDLVITQES